MTVPPNDSKFWPLARFAIVAVLLLGMLALNYNKFDARDIGTVLTVLGGLGLFDGFKAATSEPAKSDDNKRETDT